MLEEAATPTHSKRAEIVALLGGSCYLVSSGFQEAADVSPAATYLAAKLNFEIVPARLICLQSHVCGRNCRTQQKLLRFLAFGTKDSLCNVIRIRHKRGYVYGAERKHCTDLSTTTATNI